jgi:predicted phosphodiesterase
MGLSIERAKAIRACVADKGIDYAVTEFGLKRETIRRYIRLDARRADDKLAGKDVMTKDKIMQKIGENYTRKELRMLAKGGLHMEYRHTPVHNFKGKSIKIGYIGDMHIGSVYTDDAYITEACKEFKKAKVDLIVCTGDITEGMSNRPGHMYECSELGYEAQKNKAIELLTPFDFAPMYMIDGNHDRWYIKSNGALIVKNICKEIPNAEFIGHDEGDIIVNGITIKLWHGEDGSSYAISYRLQKLIESLSGGQKPHILFAGHVHKYGKFFIRNVHCISSGCIQKQTSWMKGKRLSAHTGFGILEAVTNDGGVGLVKDTFYPFYA